MLGNQTLLRLVQNGDKISSHFINRDAEVLVTNWIEVYGTVYKPEMAMLKDINEHGEPNFVNIDRKAYLLCKRLVQFDKHFHCYTISSDDTQATVCLVPENLIDYHPVFLGTCCKPSCHFQHISLRHKLCADNL